MATHLQTSPKPSNMASDKKIDTEATLTKLAPPWSHKLDPTNERLAIPYVVRLPTATGASGLCGFALGMTDASSMAALRYRAENAHRLPKTTRGWYFYHKSKNYYVLSAGAREGLKKGGMMSFWVAGFVTVEDVIDSARGGRRDFLSTVVAGLTTAGFWSAWSKYTYWKPMRSRR